MGARVARRARERPANNAAHTDLRGGDSAVAVIVPLGEVLAPVPAIGEVVVALGALIAFVVLWGLAHSWRATFGRLFEAVANVGIDYDRAIVHIHIHPLTFLHKVDHDVQAWLSEGMAASERAMVNAFVAAYHWASWAVLAPFKLGEATTDALRRAFHAAHVTTPRVVFHTIVRPLDRATRATIATLRSNAAHLTNRVDGLAARVAHVEHVAGATVATTAANVATLPARVGSTPKQLRRLARRTSALERATVGIGAAALVVAALGRLGLGWLRCPSLLRMGRRLGCAGFGWLEAFFAEAFEALVVLDLCRFALAAQSLARVVVPQLGAVLLVQNAVCLGGGARYPTAPDATTVSTSITLPSAHD